VNRVLNLVLLHCVLGLISGPGSLALGSVLTVPCTGLCSERRALPSCQREAPCTQLQNLCQWLSVCLPPSLPNTLLQGRSDKPPPSRMPVSPPQQRLGYFVALALSRAHSSRVTTPTFLPHTAPPWLLLQCGVCCVPDYFDFLHKHLFTH
jgi:hypothetical protein